MSISEQGLKDLILSEGIKRKAYLCSAGVPTIGVGHTQDVHLGDTCSTEQAYKWLMYDVMWAESAIQKYVKVILKQHEYDALVSFVFNIGVRAFSQSTLLRFLNKECRKQAAEQFKRWSIGGEGLSARRDREALLFSRGVYATQ